MATQRTLIYESKLPASIREQFKDKVIEYSQKLEINPDWLMLVMNSESGMSSSIVNQIGCVGLIQFCPDFKGATYKTINGIKVEMDYLKSMTHVQQLEYVYRYFKPFKKDLDSFDKLYLVAFFPAAIGKPDSFVIESKNLSANLIYNQNPAIAKYSKKAGRITVGDFKDYCKAKAKEAGILTEVRKYDIYLKFLRNNATLVSISIGAIGLIGLGLIGYSLLNK